MRSVIAIAVALVYTPLRAQNPATPPRFEVASVKPVAGNQARDGVPPRLREMMRSTWPPGMMPMDGPGRLRAENWAMLDLIAAAYHVRAAQVSGPGWLSDQSFDIEAKVPDGARKDEVNAMLQALLEERCGLRVHRDIRSGEGFALVVGKNGPRLNPAEPPPDPEKRMADAQRRSQENQESNTVRTGLSRAHFASIGTKALALQLARFAEAPVTDETGLKGKYSVIIETWRSTDVPGGSVFDAVEKLGLKLEPCKVPIETVVVDRVSKTPKAN